MVLSVFIAILRFYNVFELHGIIEWILNIQNVRFCGAIAMRVSCTFSCFETTFYRNEQFFFCWFYIQRPNEIGLGIPNFQMRWSVCECVSCSHCEWMVLICMKTSCGLSSVNTSIYANDAKKRIPHMHVMETETEWNKNQHFRNTSSKI